MSERPMPKGWGSALTDGLCRMCGAYWLCEHRQVGDAEVRRLRPMGRGPRFTDERLAEVNE